MVESNASSQQTSKKTPYETYKELMDESLTKITKMVNAKKCKELIALCQTAQEQVIADQNEEKLSANKYFYIFKIAIETKIPRLMEQLLYRIQKLFSYEFLDGNCKDNCLYPEGQKPPETNGRQPRLLIDAIVETICKCADDRDNQVQLEVIKVCILG